MTASPFDHDTPSRANGGRWMALDAWHRAFLCMVVGIVTLTWAGHGLAATSATAGKSNIIFLLDLTQDPGELRDVAQDHPEIVAAMEKILREQHTASAAFPFRALDAQ